MTSVASDSHRVFVGEDVVVKMIENDRHSRLDRELALAPYLPLRLMPPVLASGHYELDSHDIRYACYERAAGGSPGMGMPNIDAVTARLLSEQAIGRLVDLHHWTPPRPAAQTLSEPLDHGGFVGRTTLLAKIEQLADLNPDGIIPSSVIEQLRQITERAPASAGTTIPVHADCHWGNWLALGTRVTALLDFEWARFGEPLDDWFFLARFSGQHVDAVLDIISRSTAISPEMLRAGCEVREVAHLANDLCVAFENPGRRDQMATARLAALDELVIGRYWWCGAE